MLGFTLAKKIRQSQTITTSGERIPITFLDATGCFVVGVKTIKKDGYSAVKLGIDNKKSVSKTVIGELKKVGITNKIRVLKEMRINDLEVTQENDKSIIKMGEGNVSVGQEIDLTIIFKVGDRVNITGKSKGKGFQGVVKRHGFRGGSKTHGQSDRERAPGSIGQATTPGRVFKGKRMAGRMGNERICTRNLEIIEVYVNKLVVKGLVPGAISGIVEVKSV